MGRWGIGAAAAMLVVAGVACDRAAPARLGPHIGGLRFPVAQAVDPGVVRVGPAVSSHTVRASPGTKAGGLRISLEQCELRAPGTWFVRGTVAVPRGSGSVDATLGAGLLYGDVGDAFWTHRVTFTRSGPFAFEMESRTGRSGDPRTPGDDAPSQCFGTVLAASVPFDGAHAFSGVRTTASPEPFNYLAPKGSVQQFGIGAPLGNPNDPRTISLYTVWSGARSPIEAAFVPVVQGERPALVGMGSASSPCPKVSVAIGPGDGDPSKQVTVTTGFECGAPVDDPEPLVETHEPVAGTHGFTWARPAIPGDPEVARHVEEGASSEIWVQGGRSVARTTVARIAATLVEMTNVARTSVPLPVRPATLAIAVSSYLSRHPGMTARAHFPYRGGVMVFVENGAYTGSNRAWNYRLLPAGRSLSDFRWWMTDTGGGGGGEDRCFSGPTLETGDAGLDKYAFAITGDPRWRIQAFVDGRWRTVPTTNGVLFEDGTVAHPAAFPGRVRPVDPTGHVPACYLAEHPTG